MNPKQPTECGLIPSSSPTSLAPPPLIPDPLVTSPSVSAPTTPHSLASFFLHPASLAASLAGYPPHPWTISWMNAAAGYGFVNAASASVAAAMDLTTVHQHRNSLSSIADLRLKAKRHAEELVNVSSSANNNNNENDNNDDQASPL